MDKIIEEQLNRLIVKVKYRDKIRRIRPYKIYLGNYENEEQWLLVCKDMDKNEQRTFAMKDIIIWGVE